MRYKAIYYLFSFLIIASGLWYLSGGPLYSYLTVNRPLPKANILIVEGWLDRSQLHQAAEYFNKGNYLLLITAGVQNSKTFTMGKNGVLQFKFCPALNPIDTIMELSMLMQGTLKQGFESKFNIFYNDHLLGNDSVSDKPKTFHYTITKHVAIESISIEFLNDAIINGEDRNLLVKNIFIDSILYPVNDTNVYYIIQTTDDSAINRQGLCTSTTAKYLLLELGIKDEYINEVCTEEIHFSKTLSTALNTTEYLKSLTLVNKITGINIITEASHSRRTLLSYKKFNQNYKIGVISLPGKDQSVMLDRKNNIIELTEILFVKLIPAGLMPNP